MSQLPLFAEIIVSGFLIIGSLMALIGSVGLIRLEHFYQRIHGPAIISSSASFCILIGSATYFSFSEKTVIAHELLIGFFLILSAPVVAMMLIRAAVYRDLAKQSEH